MTRERVAMRRTATRIAVHELHGSNQSPMVGFVVLIAVALLAATVAIAAADPLLSPFLGGFALMFVAAAFVVYWWTAMLEPLTVRIDTARSALRFVQPAAMQPGFMILAFLALLPVASMLVLGVPEEVRRGGLVLLFVGGAAVFAVAQQLWSLRTDPGLTLTENGLRGVRGSSRVDLAWCDLASASVIPEKGARLVLTLRAGGAIAIGAHYIGSDPNVVAPVIDFFLKHPEHRAALATPMAALALVEEYATTTAG